MIYEPRKFETPTAVMLAARKVALNLGGAISMMYVDWPHAHAASAMPTNASMATK